jgi:hypothetical protein
MKTLKILLSIFVCFSFIINLESAVTTTKKAVTTTKKAVTTTKKAVTTTKKAVTTTTKAVTTTTKAVTTTTKVELNPCESFPCQKNSICQRINDYDYKCTCDPSISFGFNCEICKYIIYKNINNISNFI